MAQHALEILRQENLLDWPETQRIQESGNSSKDSTFRRITPRFLYHLIDKSLNYGDSILEQFWKQLGACDEKLVQNIETLKKEDFVSAEDSFDKLFRGLDPEYVDFQPIVCMAKEFFTHLGVAIMNPGGRKSGSDTAYSVSELAATNTERLLEELGDGEFGARKQGVLKELSFRRDGHSCLLTRKGFKPFDQKGVPPRLAHIIPNSVHKKTDTFKCISMFAGTNVTETITRHLNHLGNVMNMESNAHLAYDNLEWGIEAKEEGGMVRYFFRSVPTEPGYGPGFIALREGEEIQFGTELERPKPELCNLQLAVARVMRLSAAADIVLKWKEEADDDGCGSFFVASEEYCDMLDAKLFLSGRAVVA